MYEKSTGWSGFKVLCSCSALLTVVMNNKVTFLWLPQKTGMRQPHCEASEIQCIHAELSSSIDLVLQLTSLSLSLQNEWIVNSGLLLGHNRQNSTFPSTLRQCTMLHKSICIFHDCIFWDDKSQSHHHVTEYKNRCVPNKYKHKYK